MRDVDERDPDGLLDVLELDLHLLAELEVERAQRLVQQQHAGAVDERARERDALPLAARELARLALRELAQPHERERLAGALLAAPPCATRLTRSPYSTFSCTLMCGNSA